MKRIGYILTLLGLLLSPVYTFFDGASARLKDTLLTHEKALAKLNAESDSIMNMLDLGFSQPTSPQEAAKRKERMDLCYKNYVTWRNDTRREAFRAANAASQEMNHVLRSELKAKIANLGTVVVFLGAVTISLSDFRKNLRPPARSKQPSAA